VGCVITWASFRATSPPPDDSLFGRSLGPGLEAACTNPAALAGGQNVLHPYLPSDGRSLPILPPDLPSRMWATGVVVTTPFVTLRGMVEGECQVRTGSHTSEPTINGNRNDPRIDDPGGDPPLVPRNFGMHLVDVNIVMGDLIKIAKSEARAFRHKH